MAEKNSRRKKKKQQVSSKPINEVYTMVWEFESTKFHEISSAHALNYVVAITTILFFFSILHISSSFNSCKWQFKKKKKKVNDRKVFADLFLK